MWGRNNGVCLSAGKAVANSLREIAKSVVIYLRFDNEARAVVGKDFSETNGDTVEF